MSQNAGVACGSESRFIAYVEMAIQFASRSRARRTAATTVRLLLRAGLAGQPRAKPGISPGRVQLGGGAGGAVSAEAGGFAVSAGDDSCLGRGGMDGPETTSKSNLEECMRTSFGWGGRDTRGGFSSKHVIRNTKAALVRRLRGLLTGARS